MLETEHDDDDDVDACAQRLLTEYAYLLQEGGLLYAITDGTMLSNTMDDEVND